MLTAKSRPVQHAAKVLMKSRYVHMQAQESGEQFEIQDNVMYALDGLTTAASQTVRQESAVRIAEVCSSHRGRLALRYVSFVPLTSTCQSRGYRERFGIVLCV